MATDRTIEEIDVKFNRAQNKDINAKIPSAISALCPCQYHR